MKHGKKYMETAKAVDRAKLYDPDEAIALVKKAAVAKFDETIEAHIRTGCDGRHADQQIRGAVVLPHGTGKTVRVLVFAKGAKADPALTTFVISDLLGGSKILLIGNVIEQEFKQTNNWNAGRALSTVLMIFIILSMVLMNKYDKDGEGTAF